MYRCRQSILGYFRKDNSYPVGNHCLDDNKKRLLVLISSEHVIFNPILMTSEHLSLLSSYVQLFQVPSSPSFGKQFV